MKKDFLCQVISKTGTARTPYISGRSINWYNFGKQLDGCTKTLLVVLLTMAKHWPQRLCNGSVRRCVTPVAQGWPGQADQGDANRRASPKPNIRQSTPDRREHRLSSALHTDSRNEPSCSVLRGSGVVPSEAGWYLWRDLGSREAGYNPILDEGFDQYRCALLVEIHYTICSVAMILYFY